jgi:hypothetical protein
MFFSVAEAYAPEIKIAFPEKMLQISPKLSS